MKEQENQHCLGELKLTLRNDEHHKKAASIQGMRQLF